MRSEPLSRWGSWAVAALMVGLLVGCSGGGGSDSPSPPPAPVAVVVDVAPAAASISTIQTQSFAASVVNAANPAVDWRVDGVRGGDSSVGRISSAGLYTPSPREASHAITATSVEDPTKSGTATIAVTLPAPAIAVTVTPAVVSISTIQTQAFAASVVNAANPAVTWRVDGVLGGDASVGRISAAGLYTPSPLEASHAITATSVEDPTRSGSATIAVTLPPPAIAVTVTPAVASISTIQTQAFAASVVNAANPAVTWRVDGILGGNAGVGLISAAGLYTPSPNQASHAITATSVEDPTRSGSATISVTLLPPAVAVTVTPAVASISTIQTQAFAATVINAANPAVTWQVDGVAGGNAGVGLISAAGLYTPSPNQASHAITATSVQDPTRQGGASVTVTLLSGVLTYHNDNARTGQYLQETILTPGNVKTALFGRLATLVVDGTVYAQPLVVSNVPVAGQLHDVVVAVTEHNSVYAFDADTGTALWQVNFNDPANGITPVPSVDTQCGDINPEIGITSTPVIDAVTGTLYVVAMTKENGAYAHRIHALDITTGNSRSGIGTLIQAAVPGTSPPNDGNGHLVFTSLLESQRAALLLSNNTLYVSFGSFCDLGDHHGWLLTYDSKTLNPLGAFSATPTGTEGGIWQGAAADADGNVYVMTGDGTFDAASGGSDYGDSFLKFRNPALTVFDYFTPYNQSTLAAVNADLGSGGPMILPNQAIGTPHLMVGAGKQGTVYLLDRDNMGKFQVGRDSQILQSFPTGVCGAGACAMFSTPAYFNNTVYMAAAKDALKAYSLIRGRLSLLKQSSPSVLSWPGATPAVSANGTLNGIVWTLETNGSGLPAILHANAAADVSVELYTSNQNAARDDPGPAVKFAVPTVVNGKVYLGGQGRLSIYGLLP